jgi:hypothetical protein
VKKFVKTIFKKNCLTHTRGMGSWLHQAEIEVGIFSRQFLGKLRIPDLKAFRQEAEAWNRRMNRDRVQIA